MHFLNNKRTENTKNKTLYDLKIFREFLEVQREKVNVQVYSGRVEQFSRVCSEKRLKITVSDDSIQSQ